MPSRRSTDVPPKTTKRAESAQVTQLPVPAREGWEDCCIDRWVPDEQPHGAAQDAQKDDPEGDVVDRLRPAPEGKNGTKIADNLAQVTLPKSNGDSAPPLMAVTTRSR